MGLFLFTAFVARVQHLFGWARRSSCHNETQQNNGTPQISRKDITFLFNKPMLFLLHVVVLDGNETQQKECCPGGGHQKLNAVLVWIATKENFTSRGTATCTIVPNRPHTISHDLCMLLYQQYIKAYTLGVLAVDSISGGL
jgi:hypothetical protein